MYKVAHMFSVWVPNGYKNTSQRKKKRNKYQRLNSKCGKSSNTPKLVQAEIKKGFLTRNAIGNDNTGRRFKSDVGGTKIKIYLSKFTIGYVYGTTMIFRRLGRN